MDNPILNNISNSNISRNVNIRNNLSQTNTQLIGISAFVASWVRLPIQGVFIALAYWHSKD